MREFFIAGNWKMNILPGEVSEITNEIMKCAGEYPEVKTAICPPFVDIIPLKEILKDSDVLLGAQNVYPQESGAYTGETSPAMLSDLGVELCIVGHSERRQYFDETDEFINEKVKALLDFGVDPILCIGETKFQRDNGKTTDVIEEQLKIGLHDITADRMKKITIAYEPVWAIGTGDTATPEQAQEVHEFIRGWLNREYGEDVSNSITVQYGGSVKPDNARELLSEPDIDGALIGGASLNSDSFCEIIKIANDVYNKL